jgi:hypothetical protein
MSTNARQEGVSAEDQSGWLMAPWTFGVMFPYGTQFIFGLLILGTEEDGNFKLLTRGLAPRHHCLIYVGLISILPDRSIRIKQGLLRFKSLCRALLSLHHDITRIPDRDTHLLAFSWDIELLSFGNIS